MATTANNFLNKYKSSNNLPHCILLFGEETYYSDQAMQQIYKLLFGNLAPEERDNNITVFEKIADQDAFRELEENALCGGFFSENKLIIIRDSKLFKPNKSKTSKDTSATPTDMVIELLKQLPPECFCVFVLNSLPNNMHNFKEYTSTKLYKHIDEHGVVVNCSSPKSYEIKDWLNAELKNRQLQLSKETHDLITFCCNQTDTVSLSVLCNEFDKLALAYGRDKTIEKADFLAISRLSLQVSTFKLVDYLFQKNSLQVAQITTEVLAQNQSMEMLLAFLCTQIKRAVQIKKADEQGITHADFISITKANDYSMKNLRKNIQRVSIPELKRLFSALVALQYRIRTGRSNAEDLIIVFLNFCQGTKKMI